MAEVAEVADVADVAEVADVLAKLAQAGATVLPNDPAVGELYDKLGLTRPPEDRMDLDASLVPGRNDPADPENGAVENPEDKVEKRRIIWSRRSKARRIKADNRKRAAMRKAA